MKKQRVILALWLTLSAWISSCSDHDEHSAPQHQTIRSLTIRHTTPKYVQDSNLLALISSQPKSVYSEEKIDDDIRSLYESGVVNDVEFSVKKDGHSVHVIASVSTRRGLGPVLLRGNTAFSNAALWKQVSEPLTKRIFDSVTIIYDLVTDERIAHKDKGLVGEVFPSVCSELQRFYQIKGFHDVRVRVESWNGGQATATDFVFVVDEQRKQ